MKTDLDNLTREQENALIWRHTHKDSKGVIGGVKTVLVGRMGLGTCVVALDDLSQEERAEKVRYAVRCEMRRRRIL